MRGLGGAPRLSPSPASLKLPLPPADMCTGTWGFTVANPLTDSGQCNTNMLHFTIETTWGQRASSCCQRQDGFGQAGLRGGADAQPGPINGGNREAGIHRAPGSRCPSQTQPLPQARASRTPRPGSCPQGCRPCRRRRWPEPQLQHDHAGAAGLLEEREALLEAGQAALRDRFGPHRGEESLQVRGRRGQGMTSRRHRPLPGLRRLAGLGFPSREGVPRAFTHRAVRGVENRQSARCPAQHSARGCGHCGCVTRGP